MSRYRPAKPSLPKATRDAVNDAMQAITIRRMLAQGGVVTILGPNAMIRLPSGGFGTFPADLVEAAQAEKHRNQASG